MPGEAERGSLFERRRRRNDNQLRRGREGGVGRVIARGGGERQPVREEEAAKRQSAAGRGGRITDSPVTIPNTSEVPTYGPTISLPPLEAA